MEQTQERKAHTRAHVPRRNTSRRWCIPPAIEREPDEMLEASQILDESPGEVGLVLWQTLRDVTLWASVGEEARAGLFTADAARQRMQALLAAAAEPALEMSLTMLTALVGNPAAAAPDAVGLVCLQISRWAEARGAYATAIAYAQAAALAAPEDAPAAFAVGGLAMRWGRGARAETWLRRCVGLARRSRDWTTYSQAYVELGGLYARRGDAAGAQKLYVMGMRAARRHGLMGIRGTALHGLLVLALEGNQLEEAERYARGAMRAYGRGHPRLHELMHDVAYLQVGRGNHARALPMLQKLLPTRAEPGERAFTLSVLARAAAGVRDVRLYQEAWSDAWSVINRSPGEEEKHPRALLELTRASASFGDWSHMEQAARLALAAAARQKEPRVAAQVEAALAALRAVRR